MLEYDLLWECFMSEQMTGKQLEEHMNEDPEFKKWVAEKLSETLNAINEEINE